MSYALTDRFLRFKLERLRTWTGTRRLNEFNADVIFEYAGKPESFLIAFESVRKSGSVSLTGMLGGLIDEWTA